MNQNRKFSNLFHTEDWLSVWIGVIIIAIGSIAVLSGWFDFSVMSFKTWTVGETLSEKELLILYKQFKDYWKEKGAW